jgi:hypothetical protein
VGKAATVSKRLSIPWIDLPLVMTVLSSDKRKHAGLTFGMFLA